MWSPLPLRSQLQIQAKNQVSVEAVAASVSAVGVLTMGNAVLGLIFGLFLLAVSASSQTDCNSEVPAALFSNFSGLSCKPVWNNFVLRYSQSHDNVLSIVLSTIYTSGWVGMGFSKDGMMVGSSAMVGWMGNTGVPHIKQFYLRGQSTSEVVVDQGELLFSDVEPSVLVAQANIYLAFQLKFSAPVTNQHILFAIGSATPVNNKLMKHIAETSISFDFPAGTVSSTSSYPHKLKRSHGVLAILGWGFLLPVGAVIARYCKQWNPLWLYLHTAIQFIGFIIGLAAVVAGIALYNKLNATVHTHRGIGIFVLVLGILQVIAFFLRPEVDSKWRRYWRWHHEWVGRLALLFAAINIVIGIQIGGAGTSWKVAYGFDLAVLLIVSIILEVLLWTRWSRKAETTPTTF